MGLRVIDFAEVDVRNPASGRRKLGIPEQLALPFEVAEGGTGVTQIARGELYVGIGNNRVTPLAPGNEGAILESFGTGRLPAWRPPRMSSSMLDQTLTLVVHPSRILVSVDGEVLVGEGELLWS